MATGPLHGVRVLEFSIILSAPFGAMHLSDMGADVIKVEPPGGDPIRQSPGGIPGSSKFFQVLNRGRRALTVDLEMPEGREVIYRLMPSVDVVLINYRPGVAGRLGIDYETLRALRPDLIYAEVSGYGYEGPMAGLAASDMSASAYGGAVGLTDAYEEDGAPRALQPPISGDQPAGLAIAMGIIAALFHRARTGEGQVVRTSLLRAVMNMTCYFNNTDPVQDPATRDVTVAAMNRAREAGGSYDDIIRARRTVRAINLYFRPYRARDGGIAMGALTPANRAAIRKALEIEGLDQDDPSYNPSNPDARPAMEARLKEVQDVVASRTVAEWIARFNELGAPVAPVLFPEELLDDPQASLHYVEVEHPLSGATHQVAPMVELLTTPTAVQRHAPLLGQHTAEIMHSTGFTDTEIAALAKKGVVRLPD